MSYIYIPNKPGVVQKQTYMSVPPQGVKKTLFADQSARTSIYNRVYRTKNTVQNSYGGYYKKDEKPTNTINSSLWRVQNKGHVAPYKARQVAPF